MFHEIKFNPLTAQRIPKTGISANDDDANCTANENRSAGPPFTCLLCPVSSSSSFTQRHKLLGHYVLNHRQPFCAQCCTVLPTENDRMTHENRSHWPFRCAYCRREFFQTHQLEEHLRRAHGRRTCDLCEATVEWQEADDEADDADSSSGSTPYHRHLRLQHQCGSSAFDLAIAAPIVVQQQQQLPIAKFSCRLCNQQKLFVNFHGHYLNHHKVRLNKFLALALQFVQCNEEFLPLIGASKKPTMITTMATTMTAEVQTASPKVTFADVAGNFNISLRDGITDESAVAAELDFESNLVQFVASTDGESSTDDDEQNTDDGEPVVSRSSCSSSLRRHHACPFCQTEDRFDRVALGKHMQASHGFQVRNFEYRCHRCRRAFASRESLHRHNQRLHGDASADDGSQAVVEFDCPFCSQNNLGGCRSFRMHIRQHIDRHDYPCPEDSATAFYCRHCTDRFWTVDQLNAHQNARHHMQLQSAELLLCRHCGITVSSKTFLRVHTADAHASLSQIERFVFKCAVCLVAHNTLADVRAHMALVHPALVAEFCTVGKCRTRLVGKLDDDHHSKADEAKLQPLQEHIATHHVDKLKYTCKVCEHELLSKSGALKHFVIKHS